MDGFRKSFQMDKEMKNMISHGTQYFTELKTPKLAMINGGSGIWLFWVDFFTKFTSWGGGATFIRDSRVGSHSASHANPKVGGKNTSTKRKRRGHQASNQPHQTNTNLSCTKPSLPLLAAKRPRPVLRDLKGRNCAV